MPHSSSPPTPPRPLPCLRSRPLRPPRVTLPTHWLPTQLVKVKVKVKVTVRPTHWLPTQLVRALAGGTVNINHGLFCLQRCIEALLAREEAATNGTPMPASTCKPCTSLHPLPGPHLSLHPLPGPHLSLHPLPGPHLSFSATSALHKKTGCYA